MIDYEIYTLTPAGASIGPILANETELDVQLRNNDTSVLTLIVQCCDGYTFDDFPIDTRLLVCCTCDCATSFLLGKTPFFVERREQMEDANGNCNIKLTCGSATGLLARRLVAYDQANAKGKATDEFADDLLKRIFNENGGNASQTGNFNAATDSLRDWSAYISCAANASLAPKITQTFGGQTLLAAMQAVAQASEAKGTKLYFAIEQDSCDTTGLQFRTYIGQPGTVRNITVSPDNESVGSYAISEDYRGSSNRAYGVNGNNAVSISDDPSLAAIIAANPFALHEVTVSTSGTDANSGSDAANGERVRLSKVLSVDGILTEYAIKMGCDWLPGDKLTVFVEGYTFDAVIENVHISSKAGQITIEPSLSSNSRVVATGVAGLVAQVKELQRQVAKLKAG